VNCVGANHNLSDVRVANQVSIIVNNAAGLISNAAIEYSSFNGGVSVDETSSITGTTFPAGTPRAPVNNLTDAMLIVATRGFTTIFIIGDMTIDAGGDYDNMIFVGESISRSVLTISAAASVANCEFYDATITGTLDGDAMLNHCRVLALNYVYGTIESCMIGPGTITLGGNEEAHLLDCWSGVAGSGTPVVDCGGSGQDLAIRNYNGGVKLINKTGAADKISIDLNSGHVILDSTVTVGEIVVRGVGHLTNNSGATVDETHLLGPDGIALAVWSDPAALSLLGLAGENVKWSNMTFDANHLMTGSRITLYEDNTLVTPVKSWDVTATYNGSGELTTYNMVLV